MSRTNSFAAYFPCRFQNIQYVILRSFRHYKSVQGFVQQLVKRRHALEYVSGLIHEAVTVQHLLVRDRILQIPAFILQIFSKGMGFITR